MNERFTIETEGITDKEAVWEGDRVICFVEDKECIEKLVDLLNVFYDENEELKKENNMLKTTIARNESYIQQLTHKGGWK